MLHTLQSFLTARQGEEGLAQKTSTFHSPSCQTGRVLDLGVSFQKDRLVLPSVAQEPELNPDRKPSSVLSGAAVGGMVFPVSPT